MAVRDGSAPAAFQGLESGNPGSWRVTRGPGCGRRGEGMAIQGLERGGADRGRRFQAEIR
jgi:hypothetical protein